MAKLPASLAVACLLIHLGHYKNEDVCNDNQKWRRNKIRNMASSSSSLASQKTLHMRLNEILDSFFVSTCMTNVWAWTKSWLLTSVLYPFPWLENASNWKTNISLSLSFQFQFFKTQNKRQFELFCAQWHLYGYQTRSVWKKEHPRLICRWLKNKPKVNILFNIWFVSSFIKGCASFSVQVLCFVYFLNSTLGGAVLRQIFVSCLRSTTTLSAGAAWSGAKPRFSLTKIIERHRIDYRTHASSAVFVYDAHSQ